MRSCTSLMNLIRPYLLSSFALEYAAASSQPFSDDKSRYKCGSSEVGSFSCLRSPMSSRTTRH
ncbi:hypothetical protein DD238_003505 [Peronospora effusa]|uniref:Secreted protein n=1 Tax=Peronospora effusa TaxID=542832 RepID=A0A3M6VKA1_9STRA|nr:hypothetical protein DD238_003505 [Peronospora effusa]